MFAKCRRQCGQLLSVPSDPLAVEERFWAAMPKKKKAGGKKKKKDDGPAVPSATSSFQPLVLIPVTEQWVTLELKLLNWNYMNFHHRCKTDTRLFQIKNLLQEKHGRMQNLKICKEAFAERNEMVDDMATLEAEGIQGAAQEAPQIVRRFACLICH